MVNLTTLTPFEIRYLRKAIRIRLELRTTPVPLSFPSANVKIAKERAKQIDKIADWFVQEEA